MAAQMGVATGFFNARLGQERRSGVTVDAGIVSQIQPQESGDADSD